MDVFVEHAAAGRYKLASPLEVRLAFPKLGSPVSADRLDRAVIRGAPESAITASCVGAYQVPPRTLQSVPDTLSLRSLVIVKTVMSE